MALPRNERGVSRLESSREVGACYSQQNVEDNLDADRASRCHPLHPQESRYQTEEPWDLLLGAITKQTPRAQSFSKLSPLFQEREADFKKALQTNESARQAQSLETLVGFYIDHFKVGQRQKEIQKTKTEIMDATTELFRLHGHSKKFGPLISTHIRALDEKIAALQKEQTEAFDLALSRLLNLQNGEPLSSLVYGLLGDHAEKIGARETAKQFFEKAALVSETATNHLWYRLRNITQEDPQKLEGHLQTLRQIREALPELLLGLEAEGGEKETFLPEQIYGTKAQVYLLSAFSLGLLYDAHLAQEKPDWEAIETLETERRSLAKNRVAQASEFEAQFHLNNMVRQATVATMAGGKIETALRQKGREEALKIFNQLKTDIHLLDKMVHPLQSATGRDPFTEGLADLNWRLHWDGLLSLDRPQQALHAVQKKVFPLYRYRSTIQAHLKELKAQAPHLFDEKDNLNPNVNLSQTELGKMAASRTRSAYWISANSTREAGVPIAAGVAGAVGGFLACNFPCSILGGGLAAGGGAAGNTLYNIYNEETQTATRQSLETGLTRVTSNQAYLNKTFWGWSTGFAALGGFFWASPAAFGTELALAGGGALARNIALQGGLREILIASGRNTFHAFNTPGLLFANACGIGANCIRGASQVFRVVAEMGKLESGAIHVGRFLQGSFNNIPGGARGLAIRGGAGLTLLGSDLTFLGESGKLDNVSGAMGAAIFINEGASLLMRINANGLLVGNLFRVGTEWAMQAQQDMPIAQPDTRRMMWASAETATMVFFAKSYVRGGEFLGKFPLGRGLLHAQKALVENYPWMKPGLTSITNRGSPHFTGLVRAEIKAGNGNGNGNGNGHGVLLRKDQTVVMPDGRTFSIRAAREPENLSALNSYGVIVEGRGNRLVSWRPKYANQIRLGGRTISHKEPIDSSMEKELWRLGITRNEEGRFVIAEHGGIRFTGVRRTDDNSVIPLFDEMKRRAVVDSVTLGGRDFTLWSGVSRARPRFTPLGAMMVAGQTAGTAWALNKFVFSKQMRGDPQYQPLQRALNYGVSEMLTHPYIQWPLGYDKAFAELVGRTVGVPVNLAANMVFRTYRDRWPGQASYLEALQGGRHEEAFENFTDNMTSFEFVPFILGDATDDVWFWEAPALKEFRSVHDKMIAARDATKIRQLADTFSLKAERERTHNLSTVDRRGLRIMAAYFHRVLAKDPQAKRAELKPLRDIQRDYPVLFKDLAILSAGHDWEYFVNQVNREMDPAHDFHLYLK